MNVLKKAAIPLPKVWFHFSKIDSNGKKIKFRWEQLSEKRFEDFIDFKMDYFVSGEVGHAASGISRNAEAMKEFRQIHVKQYKNPNYYTSICCLENETRDIVAVDSMKMCGRHFYEEAITAQRPEVKKLLYYCQVLNEFCTIPWILGTYGVDTFFEDADTAIHPAYKGFRITTEISLLREIVSKAHSIPLTGAWMTSSVIQQSSKTKGWEIACEISTKEVEKIVGLELKNAPNSFLYKIKRVN